MHMNIFYRPFYKSDVTQFLEQLKSTRPELDAQQQAGRALLWDKAVDRSASSEFRAARVAQQPYVYQSHDQ
jgi:Tfp pilus assembly protein PilV